MRRIPLLVALVLGLSAVSARGQSTLTEGGIPVPPPPSSFSDNSRPVSGGPAQVTVSAPAPAVVYVPVSGTAPAPAAAPATVVVRLPADARLTFNGEPTRSTGATRTFLSPPLEAGRTYGYTLEAEVTQDGRKMTVTRQVSVRAGQDREVQLNPSAFQLARK
jgi:uncharacterized protein (TIGR03000 family)